MTALYKLRPLRSDDGFWRKGQREVVVVFFVFGGVECAFESCAPDGVRMEVGEKAKERWFVRPFLNGTFGYTIMVFSNNIVLY